MALDCIIVLIKNIINLPETANLRTASNHVTPMWQSNVSNSSVSFQSFTTSKFVEIPDKTIVWQMYMRSIYWKAMPKVKKSDKQWQILNKVRKRDEWATNEKEANKTCVEESSIPSVDVHVANNNLDGTPYMSKRGGLSSRNFVYISSSWDYTTITVYFQCLKKHVFQKLSGLWFTDWLAKWLIIYVLWI